MFNQFFHIVRLRDWSFSTCGRGGWSGERSGGDLAPEVSWRHRQRFHRWVLDDGVVRKLYTQVHSLLYNFVQCVPVAPPYYHHHHHHHFQQLILWFYIMVSISCICHLPSVFYIKRSRSRSTYGLLWNLGRTQFSCPSRVLRDQWTNHLRTALKTHSRGG